MQSFVPGYIESQNIDQALLRTIHQLGEYRGKEALYRQQSPQALDTLLQNAIIESTESSNRIEGVTVESPARLKALALTKTKPRNRSEQEIAGYRDVLKTIHSSHEHISFTPAVVLQFHRDLFKFTPSGGGKWKSTDNEISERKPDGTRIIRFKPVPAWQTKEAMDALHSTFDQAIEAGIEPLLALGGYVLDFLCIHPFLDGNGRMARLLTLLLLYRFNYEVGRFISLERLVEENRDGYYESLQASSKGWHNSKHSLVPWWNYFLGVVLLGAYREFEKRVGSIATARGAKGTLVIAAITRLPSKFTISDLVAKCPTVGIDYIRKVIRSERNARRLKSTGRGPDAAWIKINK